MTKKRKQQKPSEQPSEFALQLKRQKAAEATLASGQALVLTPRRMGELIYQARRDRLIAEAQERAAPARRSRKPSR